MVVIFTIAELVKPESESKQAWHHFAESTMSIEIVKDDVIQKLHFKVKERVS